LFVQHPPYPGVGPDGVGDDAIFAFASTGLAKLPNGNILVSSEKPFGSPDAITRVREYDAKDGRLVRVMSPGAGVQFRKPRGLRFGPDGLPDLYGQALILYPD
jgi:hypothetical protein